jgi:Ser/Thr protein kinase RdoA (MazF antagonist)
MAVDDTTGIVQAMLDEFGVRDPSITLLDSGDHCNARIETESSRYFLKILANGYSTSCLRSRLQFADYLREGGLPIPAALESKAGGRVASVRVAGVERLGVLSQWVEGETLGDRLDAPSLEIRGQLLARLHARSETYDPPDDVSVRTWEEIYAPSHESWLRSLLGGLPADDEVHQVLEEAAARTRTIGSRLQKTRETYGLIHGDFHGDNLIFDGETVWIVDLDDIGWGHFLFDVAWSTVLFAKHHPDADEALEPLIRGYDSIRPLSDAEKRLLPAFQLAAGLAAVEMVTASPLANCDPVREQWLAFCIGWLRRHLDQDANRAGR